MEEEKILIDRQTLKAIASDTRMDILKYLSSRKYTLSELSEKLNLKNPTVKEHLDNLIDSGLIKREESENKWKYYSLTEKGQKIVKPKEIKVLISFVISLFATFGLIGYYILNFVFKKSRNFMQTAANDSSITEMAITKMDTIQEVGIAQTPGIVSSVPEISTIDATSIVIQSSNKELIIGIAILFFIALTVFLLVLLIQDRKRSKKNLIEII